MLQQNITLNDVPFIPNIDSITCCKRTCKILQTCLISLRYEKFPSPFQTYFKCVAGIKIHRKRLITKIKKVNEVKHEVDYLCVVFSGVRVKKNWQII